jgi:serine/threonine protein kinase
MLKYIVKQRILADAYKRHKVLGVIPMEIHVLDHIRKVYRSPTKDPLKTFLRTPSETPKVAPNDTLPINVGHPNLCGMLDFFEDAENYYLVMACFGNGQDLFDYVDMAPTGLSVSEARSILGQITDAVAFLHAHGIVHRDIKDENIILDGKGGVQLIDFGSAAYIKEGKPYFDTFSGTLE